MLTQPLGHELSDVGRGERAGVDNMAAPGRLGGGDGGPAIPTHVRPGILSDDLGPMTGVNDMAAHPVREGDMVRDKVGVIASFEEAGGLSALPGIEQANIETIQTVRGRGGPDLSGRDGVAAQEKVLLGALSSESTLHGALDHSMPPFDLPFRRTAQHAQFGDVEKAGEYRLDQLADGGLAHPASACD